jgi:hypothetical protein
VVSFYVIAQYWLTHHRIFRVVTGHSEGLAWWNFTFLFTITLIPFTSGLLGLYAENPLAVDIFAANGQVHQAQGTGLGALQPGAGAGRADPGPQRGRDHGGVHGGRVAERGHRQIPVGPDRVLARHRDPGHPAPPRPPGPVTG